MTRTKYWSVSLFLALFCTYAGAAEFAVAVRNFVFVPADLEIQVGDTVTWTNESGLHNVNAPGFFRCANGCDGQGGDGNPSSNAWSFSMVFDSPGQIDYFCDQHVSAGMVGTISVVDQGTLSLAVTGACPGPTTISITGGTPGGTAAIVFAQAAGNGVIPGGACVGTPAGLSNPQPLAFLTLDSNGNGQLNPTTPAGACGLLLQVLDAASCSISNIATVPGASARREVGDKAWTGF